MRKTLVVPMALSICWLVANSARAVTVDFEEIALSPESAKNNTLGFVSRGAAFNNTFTDFGNGFTSWTGFSPSNRTDIVTPGYLNQYSAYQLPGGGGDQSPNYAVAYWSEFDPAIIILPAGAQLSSIRVTNTTYAALSMQTGDAFAKKFGGATGADADFFLLKFTGWNAADQPIGSVDFYLADFRAAEHSLDYIISQWTTVDLSGLANARKLSLSFDSSDKGQFGINTPTYVALDNLVFVTPEPSSWALLCVAAATAWPFVARRRPG